MTFERLDPHPTIGPERNPWGRCEHSPRCKRGVYPGDDTCGTRAECRMERKAQVVENAIEGL